MKITIELTRREVDAVLRSQGLTNGNGVIRSQALQSAEMKIIGALSRERAQQEQQR